MKIEFKRLSLRPYPGEVLVFRNYEFLKAKYYSLTGEVCPHDKSTGRYIKVVAPKKDPVWLVYGLKPHVLAHELAHVLLFTFKDVGLKPVSGGGEAFCYMLSQLMLEAK